MWQKRNAKRQTLAAAGLSMWFGRGRRSTVERLYGVIVAQAREPTFYTEYGVPDTAEARFDLLVLHVTLLYRRLAGEEEPVRAVGQQVFDLFIEDMDASLREMGVGDLAVPRKMRAVGEAFYGRAHAYETALREPDDAPLAAALLRNVYGRAGSERQALRLAQYVRAATAALARQDAAAIAGGALHFPSPHE